MFKAQWEKKGIKCIFRTKKQIKNKKECIFLISSQKREKGIHSYLSDRSPALPGHGPHQDQPTHRPTSQPSPGPSPGSCSIPREWGCPWCLLLSCSWMEWWDGPWLLGPALMDLMGPPSLQHPNSKMWNSILALLNLYQKCSSAHCFFGPDLPSR